MLKFNQLKPIKNLHVKRSIKTIISDINECNDINDANFDEILKDIKKVLNYCPFNVYNIYIDRMLKNERYVRELIEVRNKNLISLESCCITSSNIETICELLRKTNEEIYAEIKDICLTDNDENEIYKLSLTEVIEKNRIKIYCFAVNQYLDLISEFNPSIEYKGKSEKALQIIKFILAQPCINYHLRNWKIILTCLSKWLNIKDRKEYLFCSNGLRIVDSKPKGTAIGQPLVEKTELLDCSSIHAPKTFKSAFGGKLKHLNETELSPIIKK